MLKFFYGFVFGLLVAVSLSGFSGIGSFIGKVNSIFTIKKSLSKNVSDLRTDAKHLYSSKNDLVLIKQKLDTLLKQTNKQVAEINNTVSTLERTISSTKKHIDDTSNNVKKLDTVAN